MSAMGIAIVTSAAGCAGAHAPSASSSSAPVDADLAFTRYQESLKPFKCSNAYDGLGKMVEAGNVGNAKSYAKTYRGLQVTWDDELRKIAFPDQAVPVVDRIHEINSTELADLDALIGLADDKDTDRLNALARNVFYDEAQVEVELDNLSDALGHEEAQARIAYDAAELAYQSFYRDNAPTHAKWQAAIAAGDLNAAKAANAGEQAAIQSYLDRLSAIAWPAGFDKQVNTLGDALRGLSDFDRRQVDVPSAAQIIPSEQGQPLVDAFQSAGKALNADLLKLAAKTDPPDPKC